MRRGGEKTIRLYDGRTAKDDVVGEVIVKWIGGHISIEVRREDEARTGNVVLIVR